MTKASGQFKTLIREFILTTVSEAEPSLYRTPLIGYADADDDIFHQLKDVISPEHLLPADLLPGAKTVVAFFLPYAKELSAGNKGGTFATRNWAEAYDYTNKLINKICGELEFLLGEQSIKAAWLKPTYEFDKQRLLAQWSHKHIAYACGLGSFGRNHLLITSAGCAGRFGTLVIDFPLEPTPRISPVHYCFGEDGCDYCYRNCPVTALSQEGYNRHKCYRHCLANDNLFPDLECVEVCGKCATGPCGFLNFS